MKAWLTVFLKEVRENARDRRTLASALLYGPLVGPVLFATMISFMAGQKHDEARETIELPVLGAQYAPHLVDYLKQQGVVVQAPSEVVIKDADAAVRDQSVDLVLRIPDSYPDNWNAGEPAPVDLIFDGSRQHASTRVERVRALLTQFAQTVGALRLQVRGISPVVVRPVAVVDRDVATEQSRAGVLMAMLPYFLILAAFVGGMYLAIDTTSGERERQSLEPLLITPAPRAQIMVGKLLATSAYAAASLLICAAAFVVSFRMIPAEQIGFSLKLPIHSALWVALTVLPIALLAASAQTVVASLAKSFREAQTYLQFLILVPAVPSMILVINPMKVDFWMYALPLFGQSALINELVRGEPASLAGIAVSAVCTVLLAAALALIAVRRYRSERIVFGT